VKKLFALFLAFFVGAALVTAPMGCQGDKKGDTKKETTTKEDPTTGKKETKSVEETKK
jgi:hypothetical protein